MGIQTFSGAGDYGEELGITLGAYTLYPVIDMLVGFDNNVFAQSPSQNPVSSPYVTIVPSLEVKSNWIRHQVRALAGGGFAFYANAPSQNYQNYNIMVDGRIDIHEDFYLTPGIGYRRATEAVGTPNTAIATSPTVVDTVPLKFGVYQRFNRFFYDITGTATRYWYTDNSVVTAPSLPAAARNRWEYTEGFRFGYEITEDVALYLQPTLSQVRYVLPINSVDQDRDSNTIGLVGGATWTLSPQSSFDGNLGYNTKQYSGGSGLGNTSAWVGTLSGTWKGYSPLTLQPSISRQINESAFSNYSNVINSTLGLNFQYEIHDAWILTGGLSYTTSEYTPVPGQGAPARTDTIVRGSLGLLYSFRPQLAIGPVYEYTNGSSTDPVNGPFYSRQAIFIKLTARR